MLRLCWVLAKVGAAALACLLLLPMMFRFVVELLVVDLRLNFARYGRLEF